MMRRREFISLVTGAALCPQIARAQARTRCVGVLTGNVETDADAQARVRAFKESLYARRDGETDDLRFEIRWPGGDISLQQRAAEELVSLSPDVVLATSTATTRALRKATTSVPIVFVGLSDPTATGIVSDLARPEANVTGFMLYEHTMAGKWLSLLKQIAPSLDRIGLSIIPTLRRMRRNICARPGHWANNCMSPSWRSAFAGRTRSNPRWPGSPSRDTPD